MKTVEQQARQTATAASARRREQVAAAYRRNMPDCDVVISGEDVIVVGANLLQRWLRNAELRNLPGRLS